MRRLFVSLATCLLTPLLLGCHTIVVGDSITWGAQGAIRLAAGDDVWVDGVAGRGLYESPLIARSTSLWTVVNALAPDVDVDGTLVVQDGAYSGTEEELRRFVREVDAVVRADVCIVWVLPWDASRPDTDEMVARVLREETPAHRSALADWHAYASVDSTRLTADGVHPSAAGSVVLAEEMMAATRRCPPRP